MLWLRPPAVNNYHEIIKCFTVTNERIETRLRTIRKDDIQTNIYMYWQRTDRETIHTHVGRGRQ
jgi:hypothetical protein